jgi:hypothetical protein
VALDAVRLQRRCGTGKSLTFDKVDDNRHFASNKRLYFIALNESFLAKSAKGLRILILKHVCRAMSLPFDAI